MAAKGEKGADEAARIAAMSFEQAMAELEEVVGKLEHGEATLEESITLYERGAKLRAHCETRLKDAEERVERITLQNGQPTGTVPMGAAAPASAGAAAKAPAAKAVDDDDIPF